MGQHGGDVRARSTILPVNLTVCDIFATAKQRFAVVTIQQHERSFTVIEAP
jgi:hypothetical protein